MWCLLLHAKLVWRFMLPFPFLSLWPLFRNYICLHCSADVEYLLLQNKPCQESFCRKLLKGFRYLAHNVSDRRSTNYLRELYLINKPVVWVPKNDSECILRSGSCWCESWILDPSPWSPRWWVDSSPLNFVPPSIPCGLGERRESD